ERDPVLPGEVRIRDHGHAPEVAERWHGARLAVGEAPGEIGLPRELEAPTQPAAEQLEIDGLVGWQNGQHEIVTLAQHDRLGKALARDVGRVRDFLCGDAQRMLLAAERHAPLVEIFSDWFGDHAPRAFNPRARGARPRKAQARTEPSPRR